MRRTAGSTFYELCFDGTQPLMRLLAGAVRFYEAGSLGSEKFNRYPDG